MTPLTNLLKTDGFALSPAAQTAFDALKTALTTALILQLPDFSVNFIVECDALGMGLNAILHQGNNAISFFNWPFAPRHHSLATYERKLIGLVQVVWRFRPYLWGHLFLVCTDHYSLKFLLDQRLATIPQHHWVSKLLGLISPSNITPGGSIPSPTRFLLPMPFRYHTSTSSTSPAQQPPLTRP